LYSNGDFTWQHKPLGLRGGLDVNLTAADKLSVGGQYGQRNMRRSLMLDYNEWSEQSDERSTYVSTEEGENAHRYYSLTADYVHRFFKKDHELSLQTYFSKRSSDATATSELRDMNGILLSGQQSIEEGPATRGRLQLDYKLPLGQSDKFEAGVQNRLDRSDEGNEMYEYDTLANAYVFQPQFSHATVYTRDIYAMYSMYSGEWGRVGYQGGVRGEYMHRTIEMVGEDRQFTINRWDYFPTVHMSYQFSNGHQTMASYTRRIERPRSWWLEPFLTWTDAYNVRTGNPSLKPEYIDSYELGYQMFFGKSLLSTEAYYRITHNKVERISSTYSENIILHTVENVGTDYALGVEFMLDLKLLKWWNINCTADILDYRIDGTLYGDDFSESDFNWGGRVNNELGLSKSTKLQFNGRYRSASITSQGQREGFLTTDAAIKQEFMNKQLAVTLQVRDIFGTGTREYTSEGADFYYYSKFTREAPVFMLNISYNFNNHKLEREQNTNNQDFEGMEEY
jgi:outer membrane receptor protein involved in Fe transport